MITSLLLSLIYGFIWLLISPIRLFPDVVLPADIGTAIAQASIYLSMIDFVFPVYVLLTIVAGVLGIDAVIFGYKVIMWVIRKIPGVG